MVLRLLLISRPESIDMCNLLCFILYSAPIDICETKKRKKVNFNFTFSWNSHNLLACTVYRSEASFGDKKYEVGVNGAAVNTNSRYEVPDYSYFRLRVDLLRGEHDSN